jgi:Polyketide cyclase / dehydrase and lipid transport
MSVTPVWACQRSVDVDVPVAFAWQYMTDVANWSDPPAEFTLEGPFAAGTRGTTRMPGRPDRDWTIQDVTPGHAYTVHAWLAERVFILFHWLFDPLPDQRTRLTQRLELCGENAAAYISDIQSAFEPHLEPGMQRISRLMVARAAQDP